ncbi:hypothetical protein JDV02_000138 [Purpureocillium takamizusanense]|uniref:Mid2 domain-containing protein n=1 Tax=Purpureocillium takamizusanense TaxID=2060973 RepID=A0A9Q8Q5I9_9HYPO|nr:uncharacterized protein JDV02_000138 [Purpureocillium takamizusanense]UNI13390.1 hypothetical protein JDV02_000138 [Purpureocillium takamizusanense]
MSVHQTYIHPSHHALQQRLLRRPWGASSTQPAMLGALVWILLISVHVPSVLSLAEFFVPGAPPYPRWRAGDVQKIKYRTTYTEYTIALWQQLDSAGRLGPILFQTTNGPDTDFDWVVQSYTLNLDTSDKFFLWLFEGGPSAQGNTSITNQSSGFFYISPAVTTTSSSTSTTTSTSTPSSSSSPSSSSATPSSSPTVQATTDNGLSTGAKAGIGAGAGVAGLAILAAILLFAGYRSKKKRELEELRSASYLNSGGFTSTNMSKTALPVTPVPQQPPSELPGHHHRDMAELG